MRIQTCHVMCHVSCVCHAHAALLPPVQRTLLSSISISVCMYGATHCSSHIQRVTGTRICRNSSNQSTAASEQHVQQHDSTCIDTAMKQHTQRVIAHTHSRIQTVCLPGTAMASYKLILASILLILYVCIATPCIYAYARWRTQTYIKVWHEGGGEGRRPTCGDMES